MAKNNALINYYKMLDKKINTLTPQIYAAIALSLHREFGWGYDRINRLFLCSQELWTDCADTGKNMIQMCLDETGIEVDLK